jgi:hypothetical protein
MSVSFDFQGWDSDVELGANVFEFGDTETEQEGEFGRRRRPTRPPAPALYVGDHRHRVSLRLRGRRCCGRARPFPSGQGRALPSRARCFP